MNFEVDDLVSWDGDDAIVTRIQNGKVYVRFLDADGDPVGDELLAPTSSLEKKPDRAGPGPSGASVEGVDDDGHP